jgi:hypothetical protein
VLHHGGVQPSVESYRALARSSPWLWRSLHFTRSGDLGPAEAWLRRPGELVVRLPDGSEEYVTGVPYASATLPAGLREEAGIPEPSGPTFRPDGFVSARPEDYHLEHGDPMWQNYTWTAMLDPDELSHDVGVDDVRAGELHGREVWWARLRALEGYDPRCGCCPLLWSEVAARAEYGDEPGRLEQFAARGYPDAHEVALDVRTGVVVSLQPVGRDPHGAAFTVEIHEVDTDLDAVFAGRVATR